MAYWNPIRGLMDPITIRSFPGVYKPDDDGFSLAPGYAQDMRNLSSASFPFLSLRPGYIPQDPGLGGWTTGLAVHQGAELHAIVNGVWSKRTGSTWTALTGGGGLNVSADFSFTAFKGNLSAVNLIAANGVDPVKRYDGSTVQNLAGAPANLNFIEQHDNRLYGAVDNTIHYSALAKPEDWTTAKDAGQIVLETHNGQKITGLRAGVQHLTVFKESSIHELYGTGPSTYKLVEIANDIGAYNNKGIVVSSGVVYFISNRIYMYGGGVRPSWDFSAPVQKYLDGMNLAAKNRCVAGTNGRNVFFGIPYGTSMDCNMILEFDPLNKAWYVWEDIAPSQFCRMGPDWYIGDIGGNILKMGWRDDNGKPIKWKWISPPYSAGQLAKRISWYQLWVVVELPSGSSLSVYLSKSPSGDSDWKLVKALAAKSSIQSSKLMIPLAEYANVGFLRIKLEGSGPFRVFEIDRQMREMPWR